MKKVVLVIVDGFGIAENSEGNAITRANTPNWDKLRSQFPHISLEASGRAVGLPSKTMGNSEVGHLTIGAGRIIYQSLERIDKACDSEEIHNNETIKLLVNHCESHNSSLHLMGLVSNGNVHSSFYHLSSLIDVLASKNIPNIWIHCFTDGRDTPPTSGLNFLRDLEVLIKDHSNLHIATVVGRYYAMDRDNKWDRTKIAFEMLTSGNGQKISSNLSEIIQDRYDIGETDEFLKPIIVNPQGIIKEDDAILFFNFRPDRARQLTMAFTSLNPKFSPPKNIFYSSMLQYDDEWTFPILFESIKIENSLAEILSRNNKTQLHLAETEKYAHVTYFLNGGLEDPFPLENRQLIPSLQIDTYDQQPEMSTLEISKDAVEAINSQKYDFIVINIAGPDMVGHSGDVEATIKAVEATDIAFGEIAKASKENDYILLITADHGNAEKLIDEGKPFTAHTTNPVPFLITKEVLLVESGGLSNIAPTILDLLGIQIPDFMEKSLIKKSYKNAVSSSL